MMKYISNAIEQLRDGKRWKEMEKEMDGSKSIGKFIQLALPPYAMPGYVAECSVQHFSPRDFTFGQQRVAA